MEEQNKKKNRHKRPVIVEIFFEMAVVAVIEFVLLAMVLTFVVARQRQEADYLRSEQLAHVIAGEIAALGDVTDEMIENQARHIATHLSFQGTEYRIKAALYIPSIGGKNILGFDSLEGEPLNLLRQAHLLGRPISPEPSGVGDAIGQMPWVATAVPILIAQGMPGRGSVLVEVPHGTIWSWLSGKWFLAVYVVVLLATLLGIGIYRVHSLVVRPLEELVTAAGFVASGQRQIELTEAQTRELSDLGEHFTDMTSQLLAREQELRHRLAELERTRDELVEAEKLATVGRLASGVAHEVGNPLSAISGYLDLLQDEAMETGQRADLLRRAAEEAQRADRILRGLLDFARPKPFSPALAEMGELCHHAAEIAKGQKIFHNIEIIEETGSPVMAMADRGQIEQVLINLLVNAADAMDGSGRIAIRISEETVPAFLSNPGASSSDGSSTRLRIKAGEPAACVRIQDSGPGVAPSAAAHLFEPFFTTKAPGAGTGLGLAVSFQILVRHGGLLRLADRGGKDGQGATFEIWLPLAGDSV